MAAVAGPSYLGALPPGGPAPASPDPDESMRLCTALLIALAMGAPLSAQETFDWYGRGPYRDAVPRPDSLLGHPLGTRHTMYHEQQRALDAMIAAAPDRVRTEVTGATWEGKILRVLIISSPENLARLDAIRTDLAALADPRATTAEQAAQIAARIPAVALLSHSIHGNEPAGFEASMQTVYQLLASDAPETRRILDNVITIINPSQNPDGHERFAAWNNSVSVPTDEPAALEQSEPWSVQGRTNHYRFDMNRDFLAQSQNETRALLSVMTRWHPQLVVDLHSTTDQFFFPPTADPANPNLGEWQRKWEERYGQANAAAFDRYGWQYYVRDIFDLFYPGYVDLFPSLSGATGMTFETDGGPEILLRKGDGTVMTFADGIAHHHVASMATLGVLAAGKEERLRDYHAFRATGMEAARTRPFRAVALSGSDDPARTLEVVRDLARAGIEVRRTTEAFSAPRAHDYTTGEVSRVEFGPGTWVIDLAQPQARLATALLEPSPRVDSVFARRQLDRFERNRRRGESATREGYEFYDVTAWSLPLSYGLQAYWLEGAPTVAGDVVGADVAEDAVSVPERGRSAYVFPGGREASARLAMNLLLQEFTVGVAGQPIRANGREWQRGTYVVRTQRNDTTLHTRIAALAAETGAQVTALQSAYPESGMGVGSEAVQPLHAPRILLAAGDGVSATSFGAAWFHLEQELGLPVVPLDLAAFGRVDLADYNVLILPDGSGGAMYRALGGADRLKRFVQEGGAVIAIGGAIDLLSREEVALTSVKPIGEDEEEADEAEPDTTASTTAEPSPPLVSPTAPGEDEAESVPGIIVRATLDRTHWLTYGYTGDVLPVPVSGSGFLKPSEEGDNPVTILGDSAVISGFTWPGNTERLLDRTVWAAVENVGRGRVILFAEDPLFRAFWRGTAGLFQNALLMGPGR